MLPGSSLPPGDPILKIEDLRTQYFDKKTVLKAVDGVSLDLYPGEILGIVGESGCGKTTLGLSILNLVPHPGVIESGRILFRGDRLDAATALDDAFQARHALDLVHHADRLHSLV